MMRFNDKVAIVTGGAQGIGETYVRRLSSEGAAVVIADIQEELGQRVASDIRSQGGKALLVDGGRTRRIWTGNPPRDRSSRSPPRMQHRDGFQPRDHLVEKFHFLGQTGPKRSRAVRRRPNGEGYFLDPGDVEAIVGVHPAHGLAE